MSFPRVECIEIEPAIASAQSMSLSAIQLYFLSELIGYEYLLQQSLAAPDSDDGAEEADGLEEDGDMEQSELVLGDQVADGDDEALLDFPLCEVSFSLSNIIYILYDHHQSWSNWIKSGDSENHRLQLTNELLQ